jgi:hypothetical protein
MNALLSNMENAASPEHPDYAELKRTATAQQHGFRTRLGITRASA